MKKTLLSLSLFVSLFAKSQTLTYATFMNGISTPTDFVIGELTSFNTSLLTVTGTNLTWDASGLIQVSGTPTVYLNYQNPAGSPYETTYPGTNYVSFDPNLQSLISYQYYVINSDSLSSYGDYSFSTSHEVFQNPDKHLIFPFSYGGSFTDNYAKTNYSDATTISSYQTGTRTVTFVGSGTLILPSATYTNVGLIYELRTNSLGPDSYEYSWFDLNTGKKILYFHENDGDYTLAFKNSPVNSISELFSDNSLGIYPNPIENSTSINFSRDLVNADIKIYSISGSEVVTLSNFNGQTLLKEMHKLESGNYLFKVIENQQVLSIIKITVE